MNDRGAAFPSMRQRYLPGGCGPITETIGGMSLLEYYAGEALKGMLASARANAIESPEACSKLAFIHAKNMIEERARIRTEEAKKILAQREAEKEAAAALKAAVLSNPFTRAVSWFKRVVNE